MDITRTEHLEKSLKSHNMSHIDELVSKFKDKRDEVRKELQTNYGSKIYTQLNSGSFAKHTAINIKFDLDILVPFKKDSFTTLEDMFQNIYDFYMTPIKTMLM